MFVYYCSSLGGLAKLCSGDGKETRSLADMPKLVQQTVIGFSRTFRQYNLCYLRRWEILLVWYLVRKTTDLVLFIAIIALSTSKIVHYYYTAIDHSLSKSRFHLILKIMPWFCVSILKGTSRFMKIAPLWSSLSSKLTVARTRTFFARFTIATSSSICY